MENNNCWQDMKRPEKIYRLLDNKILADCKFLVGPEDSTAETIIGHKVMFVLESPVFEKMLLGSFDEAKNDHAIRIDDVHPHDFKNFRLMVYDNNFSHYSNFSFEEIFELHRIADKYLVSSICEDCIKYLKLGIDETLPFNQLITLFQFAFKIKDLDLLNVIRLQITNRSIKPKKFNILGQEINKLRPQLFYEYVNYVCNLGAPPTPITIFNAIQNYFKRNRSTGKDNIIDTFNLDNCLININYKNFEKDNMEEHTCNFKKHVLKLVKFDLMTTKEFIDDPGTSDLLGIDEKYAWLTCLCRKKRYCPNGEFDNYNY